jgi:hypothetical protein
MTMIKSLKEYKNEVNEVYLQNNDKQRWIFRGQRDVSWSLKTLLGRDHSNINIPQHEVFLEYFRTEIYAPKSKHYYDKPVWQLGQHYGLKTNLLDWTTDPVVALFFPLIDKDFKDKCKIFALKVTRDLVDRKQKEILPNDECPISIYDPLDLLGWNTANYIFSKELVKLNRNIKKQRGLFTYQTDLNCDLDRYYQEHPDENRFRAKEIEVDRNVLNEIRIGYPELFETDFYFRNACAKANATLKT